MDVDAARAVRDAAADAGVSSVVLFWDNGPHALSMLAAPQGAVTSLTAVGGEGDMVTLVLRHELGVSSTVMLTQFAPRPRRASR